MHIRKSVTVGSLAVVLAAFLWSLDGFLRRQLYSLPPTIIVFWEHLLGLIVLAPIVLPRVRVFRTLSRRQWVAIIGVALLSGLLGTLLYTAALGRVQYIQFSVVVLLQQLQPFFAIGAARLLLREPLTKRFMSLALTALAAAYFVSFPNLQVRLAEGQGNIIAALMALGSAAAWGSSTAFSKYSLRGTSFLHVTAIRFAFAPLFALGFIIAFRQLPQLTTLTSIQWWYILAITFSTGLVALAIYYFGLQRVPASRSTILELTWPLSAVVIGYLFFGERLTITQWLGAIVLIITMMSVAREARWMSQAV